jgi:hypothetical protein
MTSTRAPAGLSAPGRRLWASVVDVYELTEAERALLVEAARTVDQLDRLDAIARADGPVVDSPQGPRAHPALVEARQQRIALGRLIATLRLPDDDGAQQPVAGRPQRRGPRGFYAVPGASA